MSELVASARAGELEPFEELFKQPDATKKFEESKDEWNKSTALHMAAANGHTDLLKYILDHIDEKEKKRIVNLPNDHGNTALHWACLTGVLESVKLLVDAGADPMLQNESGKDSVFQAEESGSGEIVDYLLAKIEVEVDADDAKGEPEVTEGDANAQFEDAEEKKAAAEAESKPDNK